MSFGILVLPQVEEPDFMDPWETVTTRKQVADGPAGIDLVLRHIAEVAGEEAAGGDGTRRALDRGQTRSGAGPGRPGQSASPPEASRHPMSRLTTFVLSLAIAVLVAVVTNPSAEHHRRRIKEDIADRSPVAGALGVGAVTAFVSTYHSAGVASWTTAGDRTLTVGAFGMVFVIA